MTALLPQPGMLGPIKFWQQSVVNTSSTTLTGVSTSGQRLVICWMTLINYGGASGVTAGIYVNGHAVHSGAVGAGQLDRFPLDCLIPIEVGDTVALEIFGTSSWHTVGVGYYSPAYNV